MWVCLFGLCLEYCLCCQASLLFSIILSCDSMRRVALSIIKLVEVAIGFLDKSINHILKCCQCFKVMNRSTGQNIFKGF